MDFDQDVLDTVKNHAEKYGLPIPSTVELGSGLEGVVYETDDPNVVVKVSPSMKGYEIVGMKGHPGVVKILHAAEIKVDPESLQKYGYGFDTGDTKLLVLWMERLVAVGSEIFGALRIPRDEAEQIEQELEFVNGMSLASLKNGLPILDRYPAFRSLNRLISTQTWSDMSLHNVGLSRSGKVVAFDW